MKRQVMPDLETAMTSSQIERACEIEKGARSLAVAQLPASHEAELSIYERRAVELVAGRAVARDEQLSSERSQIEMLLAEVGQEDASPLSETVVDRMMASLSTLAPAIASTAAEERERHAELNAFRDAHGLHERSAEFPRSIVKHLSVLVVVGAVEAVGSASMYFGASTTGVLGAVLLALSVSAVNISVGFLVGCAWRMVMAPASLRGWHRFWAVPVAVIGLAFVVYLNLYAAHFREVAFAGSANPELESLWHLWEQPASLSVTSMGLAVFGVLCSALAAWKGFSISDRAPGYAKAWRSWEESAEAKDDLKGVLEAQFEAIRVAEIEERVASDRAFVNILKEARRRHVGLQARASRVESIETREKRAAESAVTVFRRVNNQVRTDGVVPAYFTDAVDWSLEMPEPQDRGELSGLIAAKQAEVEVAAGEHDKEVHRGRARLRRGRDGIETIMAMIVEARSRTDAVEAMDLGSVRAFLEQDGNGGAMVEIREAAE